MEEKYFKGQDIFKAKKLYLLDGTASCSGVEPGYKQYI